MKLFNFIFCILLLSNGFAQIRKAAKPQPQYSISFSKKNVEGSRYILFSNKNNAVNKSNVVFFKQTKNIAGTKNNLLQPCNSYLCISANCVNAIGSVDAAANPICANSTTTLTASGITGVNPQIAWWTGANGTGTYLGAGTTLPNVGAGTYYARLTADCGAIVEKSITITAFPRISNTTVVICNKYTWNGVEYKVSGDYADTIVTAAGCDSIAYLHLTILSVSSAYAKTDAGCFGSPTGSITITPTSGVGPYTYRIGTVLNYVPSATFNNLKAGNYRVSILDATGCAGISDQVAIAQQPPITASFSVTNTDCNGAATGFITINPTSGQAPFIYRLGTAGAFGQSNTFSNLKSGNYRAYIADANSCSYNYPVHVNQPPAVAVIYSIRPVTCNTPTGSITLSVAGANNPPYTYRLGTSGSFTATNIFGGLRPGTYRGYARDANGCVGNTSIILSPATGCLQGTDITRQSTVSNPNKLPLKATLYPNPSNTNFTLFVHGAESQQPVEIRVLDVNGKCLHYAKGSTEHVFRFGESFASGVYLVEVRQDKAIVTLKAVKFQ